MSYNRTVFLPADSDMTAEKLHALVSETFGRNKKTQVRVEDNCTVVTWGDWAFRVYFEQGPTVLQKAQEIAATPAEDRPDKDWLATCDRWIEIASDKDYNGNHFNDFLFLLQDLEEKLPDALLLVPEEGTFFDIGEFN